jgi:hypothetical protein
MLVLIFARASRGSFTDVSDLHTTTSQHGTNAFSFTITRWSRDERVMLTQDAWVGKERNNLTKSGFYMTFLDSTKRVSIAYGSIRL